MPETRKALCLGISGGSGSGKSWLAGFLKKSLGRAATIVCADWYYRDNGSLTREQKKKLNFDHPKSIESALLCRQLDALRRGEAISAPRYEYKTSSRLEETHAVEPAPLIILDGLLVLADEKIRARMDLSVYIDVPADERLVRRIRRDVEERGVGLEEVLRLYEHCVRPMHDRFIGPSSEFATWIWRQMEDKGFPSDLLGTIRAKLKT